MYSFNFKIDRDTLGIDPVGNYFNSRIQSKGIRTFGKPMPVSLFPINSSPGPGTYYHFPEFPAYLSKWKKIENLNNDFYN